MYHKCVIVLVLVLVHFNVLQIFLVLIYDTILMPYKLIIVLVHT